MSKSKSIILLVIGFILSAVFSYWYFSTFSPLSQKKAVAPVLPTENGTVSFDENLPKTESCPVNGVKYSKQQKSWWEQHRPLGVMIENHEDARPQSGLSGADAVYEAVAEGGITRFLSIFYCKDAGQIGPVRSARTYFLDFISEYGASPLYTHVGGANTPGPANALGQIEDYGWAGYNDVNQFSVGFPTFWRDYDRLGHETATEHTMYSTTKKLWDLAKTRGLTNVDKKGESWDTKFVSYSFNDEVALSQRGSNQTIHIEFWKDYSAYFVEWAYNKDTNLYLRSNGGKPHIDRDNNKQLTTKNIIVLFMRESNANDGYDSNLHLLYGTKGTGKAEVYMDGKKISGTWRKASRTARLQVFDTSGNPIQFDRGTLWFEILPTNGVVKN